jgi:8-oxo-dGTP diphosphatase
MIEVVNGAIIEYGKLLLVRKKDTWILPGGKLEQGESHLDCLCREIGEELSDTKLKNIEFYQTFAGLSPHSHSKIASHVYFAEIKGILYNVRKEDSINKAEWVNSFKDYQLSPTTKKIVQFLQYQNYL